MGMKEMKPRLFYAEIFNFIFKVYKNHVPENGNNTSCEYENIDGGVVLSQSQPNNKNVTTGKKNKDRKIENEDIASVWFSLPIYEFIAAAFVVLLLIGIPSAAVFFPGLVYTSNISKVFLFQYCMDWSTQTMCVACILRFLFSSMLLKSYVVPCFFRGNSFATFIPFKQTKIIILAIHIILKLYCLVHILILVVPKVNMDKGLFQEFNVGNSLIALRQNQSAETCEAAGMTISDVIALRSWYTVRIDLMSLFIWELCFIPQLNHTDYAHHIASILAICFLTDPRIINQNADIQPIVELLNLAPIAMSFWATFNNLCVMMYHICHEFPIKQAIWMQMSILLQFSVMFATSFGFYITVLVRHWNGLGVMVFISLLTMILFFIIEMNLIRIKIIIVQKAKKKSLMNITIDTKE